VVTKLDARRSARTARHRDQAQRSTLCAQRSTLCADRHRPPDDPLWGPYHPV